MAKALKVGVLGVGYVGLATAGCLATKLRCVAVDRDKDRISVLEAGRVPMHEKGLRTLLSKGRASKRLSFAVDTSALAGADAVFIAVGTPGLEDGSIDLSQVKSAATDLAAYLKDAKNRPLVLVRSTVVPGTTSEVVRPILEHGSGKLSGDGFLLCSNPEFLREGSAIRDSLSPERIVLGAGDEDSLRAARTLYRALYGPNTPPIVATTLEGAELVKYASNSLLATKVSFVNLLAGVCEQYPGTDINDVALGIGLDSRIGRQFLQAGPGFGGSCFPKDVKAFSAYLRRLAMDSSILDGVLAINDFQPEHVVAMAEAKGGPLKGKTAAVLGLAFKADTGDVRGSRSIRLVETLLRRGATVCVHDPVAADAAKAELGARVTYCSSADDCLRGADFAFTMTAWKEYKGIEPKRYAKLMRSPVLIDARRIYDPAVYSEHLTYVAVGRGEGRAH